MPSTTSTAATARISAAGTIQLRSVWRNEPTTPAGGVGSRTTAGTASSPRSMPRSALARSAAVSIPIGRVLGHRPVHDRFEAAGDAGADLARLERIRVDVGHRRRDLGVGGERRPAGQALVEHDAEGVHVGAGVGLAALDLLG